MKLFFTRAILSGITTLLTLNALSAQHAHHPKDSPSVHGMLLFGKEKMYLSHLPMFHSPHNYQVILEVALSPSARNSYLQAKTSSPNETVYTIVPEVFVLPEMIAPEREFMATIFQGHFERGGKPITDQLPIRITRVIFFKKFNPSDTHPEKVEYLVFGSANEVYGAHLITAKPDFDHIVQIEPGSFLLEQLKTQPSLKVKFLEIQKKVPAPVGHQLKTLIQEESRSITEVSVKIQSELYLEFGDLSF